MTKKYIIKNIILTILGYISIYMIYQPEPLISILCIIILYQINVYSTSIIIAKRTTCFSLIMAIFTTLSIVWGDNLINYESTMILSLKTFIIFIFLYPILINIMKIFFGLELKDCKNKYSPPRKESVL